jgi:hypothetical protein
MESIYFGLKCLQYPESESPLEITSIDSVIHLICWLEDQKIRELPVNEREPLRKYSENWNQEFQNVLFDILSSPHHSSQYLNLLECPYSWNPSNPIQVIYWLVSNAIRLEYEDIGKRKRRIRFSSSFCSRTFLPSCGAGEQCENFEETNEEIDENLSSQIDELGILVGIQRTLGESDPGPSFQILSVSLFSTSPRSPGPNL